MMVSTFATFDEFSFMRETMSGSQLHQQGIPIHMLSHTQFFINTTGCQNLLLCANNNLCKCDMICIATKCTHTHTHTYIQPLPHYVGSTCVQPGPLGCSANLAALSLCTHPWEAHL